MDLGTAGYRVIEPGTRPLACADIAIGDLVEIDGRNVYRRGTVTEKGENLHPEDGSYFPCMIAARIQVGTGDSGGAVLVRGIPAGVTSRSFGGRLGFTPLAEGLAQLGLELCTTPDCGLPPPARASAGRCARATLRGWRALDEPIDDETFEDWVFEAIDGAAAGVPRAPGHRRDRHRGVAGRGRAATGSACRACTACTRACPAPRSARTTPRPRRGSRSTAGRCLRSSRTREGVRAKVLDTVHHEIAHHFGISRRAPPRARRGSTRGH